MKIYQVLGLLYITVILCVGLTSGKPLFGTLSLTVGTSTVGVPIASILLAKALLIKKGILIGALLNRNNQQNSRKVSRKSYHRG